jgi:hypothetical protein
VNEFKRIKKDWEPPYSQDGKEIRTKNHAWNPEEPGFQQAGEALEPWSWKRNVATAKAHSHLTLLCPLLFRFATQNLRQKTKMLRIQL